MKIEAALFRRGLLVAIRNRYHLLFLHRETQLLSNSLIGRIQIKNRQLHNRTGPKRMYSIIQLTEKLMTMTTINLKEMIFNLHLIAHLPRHTQMQVRRKIVYMKVQVIINNQSLTIFPLWLQREVKFQKFSQ
jgi:hypothetical protein